jgi:protein subunit release factor B
MLMERQLIFSVSIRDCEVQHFRSGGKGGQNQNKRDTGCRVIHHPSGARGESREERSQLQNKKLAFKRMTETGAFRMWLAQQTMAAEEKARLDRKYTLREENVLVETRETGMWKEVRHA